MRSAFWLTSDRHSLARRPLLGVALAALTLGLAIYAFDRDWATVALLSPLSDFQTLPRNWFGTGGQFLPSFLHALAISLLLIIALEPGPGGRLMICSAWCATALMLEVVQLDDVSASLIDAAQLHTTPPLLAPVENYARQGVFDLADMIATSLGCLAALVSAHIFRRRT